MISCSHWGMFSCGALDPEDIKAYRAMTNREKLALHISLGLIDERFS